jgi:hypothetical protein
VAFAERGISSSKEEPPSKHCPYGSLATSGSSHFVTGILVSYIIAPDM